MRLNEKISPSKISGLLLLALFIVFIPYIALCFYAHPIADDYTYNQSSSFWNGQMQLFLHWNGRYTANFMIMANPILSHSLTGYRFAALLLLGFIPISIYYLITSLVDSVIAPLTTLFIVLLLEALILSMLPSLPEGIYWYPGSMTYMFGCIVAMFYIGSLIRYYKQIFIINRNIHFSLCVFLLALSVGFNEVQMILFVFGHVLLWVNIKREKRPESTALFMLILCILFSLIMFFSPGNSGRSSCFSTNHQLVKSLFMTCLQMPRFFFSWVSYAPLLIASILFAPISFKLSKRSFLFKRMGEFKPLFLFSLLWVILFLCIFPAYWSTGILGQHRTLNTACFYFILVWFLFLHAVYSKNNMAEKVTIVLKSKVQISLTLLLIGTLLFSGNSGNALMELTTGKIAAFDEEMNNRYRIIYEAQKSGVKTVTLQALQNKPTSLFVLDLQPGCNHWINQQEAQFYGLEKICCDSIINTKDR